MKVGDTVVNIHDATFGIIVSMIGGYIEVEHGNNKLRVVSHQSNWSVYAPLSIVYSGPTSSNPIGTSNSTIAAPLSVSSLYGIVTNKVPDHLCEFKEYFGLTEHYNYCISCDKKESI